MKYKVLHQSEGETEQEALENIRNTIREYTAAVAAVFVRAGGHAAA